MARLQSDDDIVVVDLPDDFRLPLRLDHLTDFIDYKDARISGLLAFVDVYVLRDSRVTSWTLPRFLCGVK